MNITHGLLVTLFGLALVQSAIGQTGNGSVVAARQDPNVLRATVEQFLNRQSVGLPGEVSVTVGSIDSRLNLPACTLPEAFLPPGGKLWGKTTVGIRCTAPSPWTIYTTATVRIVAEYVSTARPLMHGQQIGPLDIVKNKGDLTLLPNGVITDPAQALGYTVAMSLQPGTPLRMDTLRAQRAVHQGQVVKLVSRGPGFQVAAEGRALVNGIEGQIVQASTANGQVVSGIAKANGVVEVSY